MDEIQLYVKPKQKSLNVEPYSYFEMGVFVFPLAQAAMTPHSQIKYYSLHKGNMVDRSR